LESFDNLSQPTGEGRAGKAGGNHTHNGFYGAMEEAACRRETKLYFSEFNDALGSAEGV
jgi:hypothetical protein